MGARNHLGGISLAVAAGGFLVLEWIIGRGWVHGAGWHIAAGGFEAGTVGGMADWFAVTALFREVPIPVLRRHTNILVKQRARFSVGIVDMVQNRWLSAATVREKLGEFSASKALLHFMADPEKERWALDLLSDLLGRVVAQLDAPELAAFIERSAKEQLRNLDLACPVGNWIQKTLDQGSHLPLWELVLEALARTVEEGTLVVVIRRMAERAAQRYAQKGRMARFGEWLMEKSGALDFDALAESVVAELARFFAEARGNPEHPVRLQVDGMLRDLGRALCEGDPEAVETLASLQRSLVDNAAAQAWIQQLLARTKATLTAQLQDPDSELSKMIRRFLRGFLADLGRSRENQARLDGWVRDTAAYLVERNHHVIGEMVQRSLNALSDEDLVGQVQGKVGPDLQYIRLNGAVVGALVGAGLTAVRLALHR